MKTFVFFAINYLLFDVHRYNLINYATDDKIFLHEMGYILLLSSSFDLAFPVPAFTLGFGLN